jgi:tyrosinase
LIPPTPVVHAKLSGINRGSIGGSFVLATYKETSSNHTKSGGTTTQLLGFETILSRWHVSGCANCMTHLNVKSFVPLHGVTDDEINDPKVKIYAKVVPRTNKHGKTLIGSKPIPKPTLQIGKRY